MTAAWTEQWHSHESTNAFDGAIPPGCTSCCRFVTNTTGCNGRSPKSRAQLAKVREVSIECAEYCDL